MQKICFGIATLVITLLAALGIWFPRFRMKWKGSSIVCGPMSCAGFALFFGTIGFMLATLDVAALAHYRGYFCLLAVAGWIMAVVGSIKDKRAYQKISSIHAPAPPEHEASHTISSPTPVSRYAGVVATALWTLGWGTAAWLAFRHIDTTRIGAASLNLAVTCACSALGCVMTVRLVRHLPGTQREIKPEPAASWSRRLTGWVAGLVWCAVAVVWNLAVYGSLWRAVTNGPALIVLLMIPFAVIGWFLLNLLLVGLGLIADQLLTRTKS